MIIAHYYAHIDSEPWHKEPGRFYGMKMGPWVLLYTWDKE